MTQPTFIDAFAGAGGLSLGLNQAGLHSTLAFDTDPIACETLRHNLGGSVVNAAIEEIDPASLLRGAGRPDVVVGGPPCQGFSTQRRGDREDRRNDLVVRYIEFALALRPRVILMENVPGILGRRGASHMEMVYQLLSEARFEFDHRIIEAVAVGVPQRRRRAIVAAWDPDRAKPFDFSNIDDAGPTRTVRDAIGDLPPPPIDFTEHPRYANHVRVNMSALNLERIAHVPPGGGRKDVPEGLQMACHRGSAHRHLDVFGRLEWDAPAGTITAMFDNFTRGRFAHPSEDRNITNREGARLQSFPDTYVFRGAKKQVARQIGNAVPPLLGAFLGQEVMRQLGETPRA